MFPPLSMMLVKLGGSVITDKSRYRTLRAEALSRLAQEIRSSGRAVMIVHGAGSYGHIVAAKHQLQKGYSDRSQIEGLAQVMEDVRLLNLEVVSRLNRAGVPSVSLPPSAVAELSEGGLSRLDLERFARYMELGLAPVTFGDAVLDSKRKFGICSGDQLMESLAERFKPERIIFVSDVDGVFTSDPGVDPHARLIERVDRAALDSLPRSQRVADVTGSIFGKIECMLRIASHGGDAVVINGTCPGRLEAALRGQKVIGSKVVGGDG